MQHSAVPFWLPCPVYCFIYGGGLTAAFDVYLTDRIIFLLQVKERALFGADAGNFHTQVGLGLRLIIN